jgi:Na+/H+ antiporter NhaD/arsenite permease-like protein
VNLASIPLEFILFACTLLGVAMFHRHALAVAASGLVVIAVFKLATTGFHEGPGLPGLLAHLGEEAPALSNLFMLLTGFALLSRHFELSHLPSRLPDLLPDDWRGGFVLLALVFVLSGFLDNIAAALIGGTVASSVFRGRVHVGYLAALVAAANAGGAGSVIGDTTTTMMWIDGVSPMAVLHAYLAAGAAFLVFAVPGAIQQQRFAPITKSDVEHAPLDWPRVAIVGLILVSALVTNVIANLHFKEYTDRVPFLGLAVWGALLATAAWRRPDWAALPDALIGTIFLLCLVTAATMMPVERLPPPSWQSALGLGFVSAVFDNIPLTKLALEQGGYDWGVLAYTVGFGGSMVWFGSSAGVAITNLFPQARSVWAWLKAGWSVPIAYVFGFAVLLAMLGWRPH